MNIPAHCNERHCNLSNNAFPEWNYSVACYDAGTLFSSEIGFLFNIFTLIKAAIYTNAQKNSGSLSAMNVCFGAEFTMVIDFSSAPGDITERRQNKDFDKAHIVKEGWKRIPCTRERQKKKRNGWKIEIFKMLSYLIILEPC